MGERESHERKSISSVTHSCKIIKSHEYKLKFAIHVFFLITKGSTLNKHEEDVSHWLCSHGLESRSERRFGTWFGPFLIWKPDFSPGECKAVSNQAFETRFAKREKKGVLDRDPPRKPDSRPCERKALSERDSCVCILKCALKPYISAWVNQRARTA